MGIFSKPQGDPGQISCPECGSTQITAQKKGYGLGKGLLGGLLLGPLGLAGGLLGSGGIKVVCIACGASWRPGDVKPQRPRPEAGEQQAEPGPSLVERLNGWSARMNAWAARNTPPKDSPEYQRQQKSARKFFSIVAGLLAFVVVYSWMSPDPDAPSAAPPEGQKPAAAPMETPPAVMARAQLAPKAETKETLTETASPVSPSGGYDSEELYENNRRAAGGFWRGECARGVLARADEQDRVLVVRPGEAWGAADDCQKMMSVRIAWWYHSDFIYPGRIDSLKVVAADGQVLFREMPRDFWEGEGPVSAKAFEASACEADEPIARRRWGKVR